MKQNLKSNCKTKFTKLFGLLCLAFCMALFALPKLNINPLKWGAAAGTAREINYSIFMHSPSFALEYNTSGNNLYFVDEYDMQLKVYSESADLFEQQSLSLNSFNKISDAAVSGDYLFLLGEVNRDYDFSADTNGRLNPESEPLLTLSDYMIEIIDLKEFEVLGTLYSSELKSNYTKLSVCFTAGEETQDLFMAVTPDVSEDSPISEENSVLLFSAKDIASAQQEGKNNALEFKTCKVTFSEDAFASVNINSTLFKVLLMPLQKDNTRLIYLYGSTIGSAQVANTDLTESSYSIANNTQHKTDLKTSSEGVSFVAANLMNFDSKAFIFISYNIDGENSTSSYLYTLQFGVGDRDNKVELIDHAFTTPLGSKILCQDKYVYYPSKNSSGDACITRLEFQNAGENNYTASSSPFENPKIEIEWYSADNFDYVVANKDGGSSLKSKPWSANSLSPIAKGDNLAVVGKAKIVGTSDTINIDDFYYCHITQNGDSQFGFVPVSDVEVKSDVPLSSSNLRVFKVVPNTKLYSYPCMVVGTVFDTSSAVSEHVNSVVMSIDGNMPVEPLNFIKNYESDSVRMLKVKVNGDKVGYIEYQKIVLPNDKNNFVITNSAIKNDTAVFLTETGDTTLNSITLKKGYRVRLDGARTSKSGRIKVTFNDEYGNEFTGYIQYDLIETDSWTFLQIFGFILIAINIGLLILILIFKHKKIGYVGTKYDKAKKPIHEPHGTLPEE